MRSKSTIGLMLWLIVVGTTSTAFAQATGTFNGRVIDAGGGVLPGTTVSATARATGVVRIAVTNDQGLYSITALNPGVYDVKAEIAGFGPSVREAITLVTDTTLTLDFTLGVAAQQETITVTGEAPLLETTEATASSNLQNEEVQELPMLNRGLGALIQLTPGAREETARIGVAGTASTHAYFNVGGNGRSTLVLVDGTDNHDDIDAGATIGVYPRRDPGVQGAPARFFRGVRQIGWRHRHAGDEVGHERAARLGILLWPQRQADENRLLLRPRERRQRQASVSARAIRRVDRRPD